MAERPVEIGSRASYREGLSFGFLTFVALAFIGVGSSILIARIYGIQVMGEAALALAPVVALDLLASVRGQAALIRELSVLQARAPRITGLFVAVLAFSSLLAVGLGALILILSYFVYRGPLGQADLFAPAVVAVLSYVFLANTSQNADMVFAAFRAARRLFWVKMLHALTYAVVAVVAGLVWGSVWGLILAVVGAEASAVVFRLSGLRRFMASSIPRDELNRGFRTLPQLVRFGLKVTPGSLAGGIGNIAGTFILGVFGSIAMVGAWNRAWSLGNRLLVASNRITEMLLPTLVERDVGGDRAGFDRSLMDTLRYAAVGMLMAGAAGGGAANGVMDLFGPGFDEAAGALAIILVLPAMASAGEILNTALLARDRAGITSIIAVSRMLITLVATIVLTVWIGVIGTALAVLLGYAVSTAALGLVIGSTLSAPLRRLWTPAQVGAMLAAYAAGFFVAHVLDRALPGPVGLVVALAGGCLAYAAVILLAGGVAERDRARFASIRAQRRTRRLQREAEQASIVADRDA